MYSVEREAFETMVAEALDALPAFFRDRLENLAIVVEEWPDRHTLDSAGLRDRRQLLGLYHGIPLTARTTEYGLVPPDKISIYRQPIMLEAQDEEDLREVVRHTLFHEVAHYFGIDDSRLTELGAY